jgi:hypothetical protein
MEEHSILVISNDVATKLAFHLQPWLVFWHQIPWIPQFLPSLHNKNTKVKGLISIIKVFNNKIELHLHNYNGNSTPIANAI